MTDSNINSSGQERKPLLSFLAGLVIVLVAVGLYFDTHRYSYAYDDLHTIKRNLSITESADDFSLLWKLFGQEYWTGVDEQTEELSVLINPKGQGLYRPVMLFIWGVIYHFQGDDPTTYHVLNIILYALVCLLVGTTIRLLFGSLRLGFFCGLLFACHPIHTEVAAYITGLGEILTTLFILLSLITYYKATYQGDRFKPLPYLLSLLFFLIGMFSKEGTVTLLALVILYDIIKALQGCRPLRLSARIGLYAGYVFAIGLNILARFKAIGSLQPSIENQVDNVVSTAANYGEQFWTAMKVLVKGIWLTIIPMELSPDYSYQAIELSHGPFEAEVLSALLFMGVILAVGLLSLKKRPIISFGIFWYLINIFIVSNLLVIIGSVFGERFLFAPSLGFCLVAAYLLDRLCSLGKGKPGITHPGVICATILLVTVSSVYSMKTLKECKKWETGEMLWQHAVEVVPESCRAHIQLAQLYSNNQIFREAEKEYWKAIHIYPEYVQAYLFLSGLYQHQGQYEKALELVEAVHHGIKDTNQEEIKKVVQEMRIKLFISLENVDTALDELLALRETYNTGEINKQIGAIYVAGSDYGNAVTYLEEALTQLPDDVELAYRLLNAYGMNKQTDKEQELLARVEERDAGSSKAHLYQAQKYMREFETEKAMAAFDKAIAIDPDDSFSYIMKAKALAGEVRIEEALAVLDQAESVAEPEILPNILLKKLELSQQIGDTQRALEAADLLKNHPVPPSTKVALGHLYFNAKQYPKACQHFRNAIAEGAWDKNVVVTLAHGMVAQDKYEDIAAYFGPMVEDGAIKDPELNRILGTAYITIEEYQKGIDLLEELIKEWGPNPWTTIQIAAAEMKQGQMERALTLLDEQAAKISQAAPLAYIHQMQAAIYLESDDLGNPEKAVSMARKALEKSSKPNPSFYLTLVKALQAAERPEEARKELEVAREKFPKNKELMNFSNGLK